MRLAPILALCALCACGDEAPPDAPPLGRFYFPSGIVHVADGTGAGHLYVASSDFDKRYDYGAVTAVDLNAIDALALPPYLGGSGAVSAEVQQIEALPIEAAQQVSTAPFAGLMDVYLSPEGKRTLFVPTRSEGDFVYAINADGVNLSCEGGEAGSCIGAGISLTAQGLASRDEPKDGFEAGKPRAPEPFAAKVVGDRVYITHLQQADSPVDSGRSRESFLVTLDANAPQPNPGSFHPIGTSPAHTVAVGQRYAYLAGRIVGQTAPPVLRLMDTEPDAFGVLVEAPVETEFRILEGRGILLSEDETRLFLVGRNPDTLLVARIDGPTSPVPTLRVVRSVPLPDQPDQAVLIPRGADRGPLLAITCYGANSVAIYDDEIGTLATVVTEVGEQPFGISVHRPAGAPGARLYVSNFGDGQVAVIDIENVDAASGAKLVAKLGQSQLCLTDSRQTDCPEDSQ